MVVKTGAIGYAKLKVKSSPTTYQHPSFYRPAVLHVTNQQCEKTEGKSQ